MHLSWIFSFHITFGWTLHFILYTYFERNGRCSDWNIDYSFWYTWIGNKMAKIFTHFTQFSNVFSSTIHHRRFNEHVFIFIFVSFSIYSSSNIFEIVHCSVLKASEEHHNATCLCNTIEVSYGGHGILTAVIIRKLPCIRNIDSLVESK